MSDADAAFEQLVAEAWDNLPPDFREFANNVEVVVEPWADEHVLRLAGVAHPSQLLGFYHGVPLTRRTRGYQLVPPDKISLYQNAILMRCRTIEEARAMVRRVLLHEIAHHFGISDARLRELGAY